MILILIILIEEFSFVDYVNQQKYGKRMENKGEKRERLELRNLGFEAHCRQEDHDLEGAKKLYQEVLSRYQSCGDLEGEIYTKAYLGPFFCFNRTWY